MNAEIKKQSKKCYQMPLSRSVPHGDRAALSHARLYCGGHPTLLAASATNNTTPSHQCLRFLEVALCTAVARLLCLYRATRGRVFPLINFMIVQTHHLRHLCRFLSLHLRNRLVQEVSGTLSFESQGLSR